MQQTAQIRWFYGIAAGYALLNAIFIANNWLWLIGLPLVVAVGFLALARLDKLFLLITFLTPLSVNLIDKDFGFGLNLPTEPLIFGAMLLFFYKIATGATYDKRVLKHPITWAILFGLVWIAFTTLTSSMILVSFKFLLARLWFVVTFYFLAIKLFADLKNIKTFLWLFIVGVFITCIYTVIRHAQWGFGDQPAHWVMTPFYNDHTSYGAVLAFIVPVILGFLIKGRMEPFTRALVAVLFTGIIIATILSYTRAAWVGLVAAVGVYVVMLLRIRFTTLFFVGLTVVGIVMASWSQIMMRLEKNDTQSSKDLAKHIQSVSNVTSDASNLERINRWQSALRMFEERPITGFGPGTYMFKYAPYQFSYEKTRISTNNADGGNAHSEYIGPLAEQGVFGMLSFVWLVIVTLYTAIILFPKVKDPEVRMILQTCMLGLITYYIHGFLNNFLDTDKASVPFWGYTAIIVAIQLYHTGERSSQNA